MARTSFAAACVIAMLGGQMAQAHHSFAVFFDSDRMVKLKGTVTAFHFTNPHGIIAFDVTGSDGKVQKWRAETNAPVILMRRGWTRASIKPGDVITIDGWAARDGKPYLRLRQAHDAAGKMIGQTPFGQSDG